MQIVDIIKPVFHCYEPLTTRGVPHFKAMLSLISLACQRGGGACINDGNVDDSDEVLDEDEACFSRLST